MRPYMRWKKHEGPDAHGWDRIWLGDGKWFCGVCGRRLARTCVWLNYDTRELRHLCCFTPEGFVPDACTEEENEAAARAERRQCQPVVVIRCNRAARLGVHRTKHDVSGNVVNSAFRRSPAECPALPTRAGAG